MASSGPTQQHDTDRVRVTRWDLDPGERTGPHRHEYDYVVVPLTDGRLGITAADGSTTTTELVAGTSYVRAAGAEHDVGNGGAEPLSFVEVELK